MTVRGNKATIEPGPILSGKPGPGTTSGLPTTVGILPYF